MKETNMSKKKFDIVCEETTKYQFEVMADNKAEALAKAHKVLLGDDKAKGALRCEWPKDAYLQLDCTDRCWDVSKASPDDERVPVDTDDIPDASEPSLDSGLIITRENALTRIYDDLPYDIEDLAEENPEAADDYAASVLDYMTEDGRLKAAIAADLWDGSYNSGVVMDIVDTAFSNVLDEYERERKEGKH
jgi:hypothetical protein